MDKTRLSFDEWLDEFVETLAANGLPRPQAEHFRGRYLADARGHYESGDSVDEACVAQLMG